MEEDFRLISIGEIIEINRRTSEFFGGTFLNENALVVVLDAMEFPMFGIHRYPTLLDKVSALVFTIIQGHVFRNGNKRTALIACKLILGENGLDMSATLEELIAVSKAIQEDLMTPDEFIQWLNLHVTPF